MDFFTQIQEHANRIKEVAHLCTTEETTKQALILPMLHLLGFSPFDPKQVRAEYKADFLGAKASEKVDYALFGENDETPMMFLEAKGYNINIRNHIGQLARYFNSTPDVSVGIITNGRLWLFFTDLNHRNIMDNDPFLEIDLTKPLNEIDIEQLQKFHRAEFDPDGLRNLAVNNSYILSIKDAIKSSFLELDTELIRFFATKAGITRQLNERFLKTLRPIVHLGIEEAYAEFMPNKIPIPISPQEKQETVQSQLNQEELVLADLKEIIKSPDLILKNENGAHSIYLNANASNWFCQFAFKQNKFLFRFAQNFNLNDANIAHIWKVFGFKLIDRSGLMLNNRRDIWIITELIQIIHQENR